MQFTLPDWYHIAVPDMDMVVDPAGGALTSLVHGETPAKQRPSKPRKPTHIARKAIEEG